MSDVPTCGGVAYASSHGIPTLTYPIPKKGGHPGLTTEEVRRCGGAGCGSGLKRGMARAEGGERTGREAGGTAHARRTREDRPQIAAFGPWLETQPLATLTPAPPRATPLSHDKPSSSPLPPATTFTAPTCPLPQLVQRLTRDLGAEYVLLAGFLKVGTCADPQHLSVSVVFTHCAVAASTTPRRAPARRQQALRNPRSLPAR